MATIKPELRTILDRYGINPNDQSQVWDCRGTLVLYHKAYEIIAAKESISFDPPTVIRAEKNDAVILVTGHMKDRSEWSFGEAVIDQNYLIKGKQAAYPWAMAEKRAKDRVIAKLVGLAAYVLSEDEADELKDGKGPTEGEKAAAEVLKLGFDGCETVEQLDGFWREHKANITDLPEPLRQDVISHASSRKRLMITPAHAAE